MEKLECAVQHYAWGKTGADSFIALLLPTESVDENKQYAELWMGTHPHGPSILRNNPAMTLQEYLQQNPNFLGAHERGKLNFLFKVLSVNKALSIQSHPTKEQAARLHVKYPQHYPDDNHKPEMLSSYGAILLKESLIWEIRKIRPDPR